MREDTPVRLKAYRLIKEKIIRNEFGALQRINDTSLAREMDLSRTPIREALIMLEAEGLIARLDASRGFCLRPFSIKDVYDLYEFRETLEVSAAGRAIKTVGEPELAELVSILEEVNQIIDMGKPSEALVKAVDFHIRLLQVCTQNKFVLEAAKSCFDKLILISWSCPDIGMSAKSAKEHAEIIDALRARDLERLTRSIRQHLVNARDRALSIIQVDTKRLFIMP